MYSFWSLSNPLFVVSLNTPISDYAPLELECIPQFFYFFLSSIGKKYIVLYSNSSLFSTSHMRWLRVLKVSSGVIGNLWLIFDAAVESYSLRRDESLESINLFVVLGTLVELRVPGADPPALVGEAMLDTPNETGLVLFLTELRCSLRFGYWPDGFPLLIIWLLLVFHGLWF